MVQNQNIKTKMDIGYTEISMSKRKGMFRKMQLSAQLALFNCNLYVLFLKMLK